MRPERRHVDLAFQPASAWVRFEPLGVIGIIAPWNYPLQLALAPLVDAFAAGNRAMIKPSELTPALLGAAAPGSSPRPTTRRRWRWSPAAPTSRQMFSEPALRPPALHRLDRRRPHRDAGGGGEPDAGHARARRQVARDPLRRLPARQGGAQHRLRQVPERRPDLHRARLCAGAQGPGRRLRPGGARPGAPVLSRRRGERRLYRRSCRSATTTGWRRRSRRRGRPAPPC